MYEYVKSEKGWVLCWGGAALYRETNAPATVVRTAEPVPAAQGEREPVKVLSA